MRLQAQSHKKTIVENNIKNAINIILKQELGDNRFKDISITKVELNKDKSVGKIYWDSYLEEKTSDFSESLKKSNSKIRSMLAKHLNLRFTPRLDFIYDSQYVEERAISKIINENKKETNEQD